MLVWNEPHFSDVRSSTDDDQTNEAVARKHPKSIIELTAVRLDASRFLIFPFQGFLRRRGHSRSRPAPRPSTLESPRDSLSRRAPSMKPIRFLVCVSFSFSFWTTTLQLHIIIIIIIIIIINYRTLICLSNRSMTTSVSRICPVPPALWSAADPGPGYFYEIHLINSSYTFIVYIYIYICIMTSNL